MANGIIISQLSPQGVQITFSGSSNSNNNKGNYQNFSTLLTSGVITQNILYLSSLSSLPTSVNCTLINNQDSYSYMFNVSGISTSGFFINFSDYLKNSGYYLSTEIDF